MTMTLKEAIEQRNGSDDLLQWENERPVYIANNGRLICPVTGILFAVKAHHVTYSRWKIIPAEPKVLTAKELAHDYLESREDAVDFAKRCDKNGYLRRTIEVKPLIEAAGAAWLHCDNNDSIIHGKLGRILNNALKNLQPIEGV